MPWEVLRNRSNAQMAKLRKNEKKIGRQEEEVATQVSLIGTERAKLSQLEGEVFATKDVVAILSPALSLDGLPSLQPHRASKLPFWCFRWLPQGWRPDPTSIGRCRRSGVD